MGIERLQTAVPTITRAVVYHSSDDLRLEEVPLPALGGGELLVRIRACGLCPGEVMGWYMDRKAPTVLGHEPVGEVVAAGEGVTAFAPGDRVFVHHHAPCMTCRFCVRGDHVHCATFQRTRLVPGGLSQYAVVPAENVRHDTLKVPHDLTDEQATFVEPLACVVKSLRRAGVRSGDRVLVIGLGVMGLLHVMLARRLGAVLIVGADRVPARLAAATRSGADATVDVTRHALPDAVRGYTDGVGADVVVVGPGSVEAIEAGFQSAAPAGTLMLFTPTPPAARWPLPVHDLYFREVRVITSYSAGPPETRDALEWLRRGLPVEQLVTHRYALTEAVEGYRRVREASDALKVVVQP